MSHFYSHWQIQLDECSRFCLRNQKDANIMLLYKSKCSGHISVIGLKNPFFESKTTVWSIFAVKKWVVIVYCLLNQPRVSLKNANSFCLSFHHGCPSSCHWHPGVELCCQWLPHQYPETKIILKYVKIHRFEIECQNVTNNSFYKMFLQMRGINSKKYIFLS